MLTSDLSQDQSRNSLEAINIIKEKRVVIIKGQSVANGGKQELFYNKYEITSTEVSTYVLLMTLMIDAWERLVVGTSYVPGAYIQADREDFLIFIMVCVSVDVLCNVKGECESFVTEKRREKLIYL